MFKIPNPVARTVKDTDELQASFKKYGIIPYYGLQDSTSHATLTMFNDLTQLSPSFNMVMKDLYTYSFGNALDVVPEFLSGMVREDVDDEGLEFSKKMEYRNYLASRGISFRQVLKICRKMLRSLKDCGNAYFGIKCVRVGDAVQYSFQYLHYKQTAYLNSTDDGIEFLINSRSWADEYLQKHDPKIVRVSQYDDPLKWDTIGDGIEYAIIHIQSDDDNDESEFYARPDIIACLDWLFVDYRLANLNSKIANTDVVSKTLLAFEAPDPNTLDDADDAELKSVNNAGKAGKKDDYFDRNMYALRQITTNLGDHDKTSSIGAMEYPHGGKPPTKVDLELNRDTKHHAWQQTTANKVITGILGWHSMLTNFTDAKANLGGNVLMDIFVQKTLAVGVRIG